MAEAGFGLSQGERAYWEEVQGDQSGERQVAHKGLFWRKEGWLQSVIVPRPKGSLRMRAALALAAVAGGCLWRCSS